MTIFDFNAALGRAPHFPGGFDSAGALAAEMQRLRIDAALVYQPLAVHSDVTLANSLLSQAVASHDHLHACWAAAPSALAAAPAEWVKEAVESGARAIRLFPIHGWPLESGTPPLFDVLEAEGIPLLLDFDSPDPAADKPIPWRIVGEIAAQHPRLQIVVLGARGPDVLDAMLALRGVQNLFLETHGLDFPDALAFFVAHGLSDRLVFGTGAPFYAGEDAVHALVQAGLKSADFHAIASSTARRLLGLTDLEAVSRQSLQPFRRASGLIVDVDAHAGAFAATPVARQVSSDVVTTMYRCGVQKLVVGSLAAVYGETRAGNQQTIDLLKQFPEHLHGYASVNPHYAGEAVAELERCFKESGNFAGVELDCRVHGLPLDAPGYEATLAFAQVRGVPVLVHESGEEDWDALAARFPEVSFIIEGMIDPFGPGDADHLRVVRQHPNLYVALTGLVRWRGALAKLVELAGAQKVLFGSGFPARDLAHAVGGIQLSELNSIERVDISGGNALRIFKTIKPLEQEIYQG